ncbi:uncharacterized protein [Choristoneura fumiferana]|uniref:uncharacterized protein n=1 Tax=Choristoneura fumiferana TaxID=7141 RepID=UPI003D15CFE3
MLCVLCECKSRIGNKENGQNFFHRFPEVGGPVWQKRVEFVVRGLKDRNWMPWSRRRTSADSTRDVCINAQGPGGTISGTPHRQIYKSRICCASWKSKKPSKPSFFAVG